DTLAALKQYVALFHAPELVGLRGTSAELHDFAARYHAAYSVHPSPVPADYAVTHTAACYVFNRQGKAEFLCAGLSAQKPDLEGITRDLRHLIDTGTI
ncbi:MAG TPA: SCO family protein, partial [Acidiphilium sp.]